MRTFSKWVPLALALVLVSCAGVQGNGKKAEEKRQVPVFTGVEVNGGFHLALQVDPNLTGEVTLNISGDENLLPLWKSTVEGSQLRLNANKQLWTEVPLSLEATTGPLSSVLLQGSAEGTIKGLSGEKFHLETSGSSDMVLAGKVKALVLEVSGSGKIDASAVDAAVVTVDISGSGEAKVQATAKLKVDISGSGKVEYAGSPPEVTQNISGSGELVKK